MAGGSEYDVALEEIAREGIYDQVGFRLPDAALPDQAMTWVTGTINGRDFQANASPAEDGSHWVFVPIELRRDLGVGAGDRVHVRIDAPETRTEVRAPDDFREALAAGAAGLDFEQFPPGERRDYVRWVEDASGEERADRIRRAVEAIRARRPVSDLK